MKTTQLPLPGSETAPDILSAAQPEAGLVQRVRELERNYRARIAEIVERAAMPHDLPSPREALETPLHLASGPKKPALDRAFKPLGYQCRGETGAFTLQRKTSANLTIEITLDVGTWSNSLLSFYHVMGVGFAVRLPMPPTKSAIGVMGQYKIGDADRWQKIVENLAALVVELDRTFVPEVEAAAGPVPAWFEPSR